MFNHYVWKHFRNRQQNKMGLQIFGEQNDLEICQKIQSEILFDRLSVFMDYHCGYAGGEESTASWHQVCLREKNEFLKQKYWHL